MVLLDQFTKYLVRTKLYLGEVVPVTPFFRITFITNTGVAFGMFQGGNVFFIIFTLLVLTAFYFWYRRWKDMLTSAVRNAFILILAGAIGNLIDRVVHGCVIDFLELHIKQYSWPAFNVADSCISIGGALLFVSILLDKRNINGNVPGNI